MGLQRVGQDWATFTSTSTSLSLTLWASLIAQLVKNLPAKQETLVWFLGQEDTPGEAIGYPLQHSWVSPVAQLEEGQGYPLQYSGLENSIDCKVHGVAKSWTGLSNFYSLFTKSLLLYLPLLYVTLGKLKISCLTFLICNTCCTRIKFVTTC